MLNTFLSKSNTIKASLNFITINLIKSHHNKPLLHKQAFEFTQRPKGIKKFIVEDPTLNMENPIVKTIPKKYHEDLEKTNDFQEQTRSVTVRKTPTNVPKQIKQFFNSDQQGKLQIIEKLKKKLKIKELSIIAKELLFETDKSNADIIWCALQQAFISLLEPTNDQDQIRSLSKFLYSLGKSKRATHNYETQMALLLPFSSNQSFVQIVTTISRMGGMSEEFSHIVEKLYWKRREEFSPLEMNLINYVLAKNGKKIDPYVLQIMEKFPLRSIVMMLKSFDMTEMMSPQVLKKCIPLVVSRERETNLLDFRGIFNIYCKYLQLDSNKITDFMEKQYKILARNINEEGLQQIWEHFPKAVNSNKLPIAIVEEIIKSLRILKTKSKIGQRTWKKIALSFNQFENLQIRIQLQRI